MRVTDEMVQAALDAQPFTANNSALRVWQLIDCDGDRTDALMRAALEAALSHAAGQEVDVPEVVRTAPERIWLQVADDTYYASEPFPYDIGEVTWCQASVMSVEVKYIRADLVPAVARSEGED